MMNAYAQTLMIASRTNPLAAPRTAVPADTANWRVLGILQRVAAWTPLSR